MVHLQTSWLMRPICWTHTVYLGEIQLQNDIFLDELKNFLNKTIDFNFFFIIYRIWLGLPVSGVTRNIRYFFREFFNLQSSLNRYNILVFRILKICLAVPSGSNELFLKSIPRSFFDIFERFRPLNPEWASFSRIKYNLPHVMVQFWQSNLLKIIYLKLLYLL